MTSRHALNRRQFLATTALAALAPRAWAAEPTSAELERMIFKYIAERGEPGAQLAVGRNGKILWSKAFGLADREKKVEVTPQSLFRIASVSKPLTAVATLTYMEEGKLSLDTKMMEVLKIEPRLAEGAKMDERVKDITIRQLLNHTAGWNRDTFGDPMFMSRKIAKDLGVDCPPGARDIIRWMLGQPLQADPGTKYVYSNLGFAILGRILENLSGQTHEKLIKERVLKPAGVSAPHLGATLTTAEGEVHYYMRANVKEKLEGESIFPGLPAKVLSPYGAWCLEAMDAHGGWISSAEDMVRFIMSLPDVGGTSPFHKKDTWITLSEPPPGRVGHDEKDGVLPKYYACGFQVEVMKDGHRITHAGSLPGTTTFLWRRPDGYAWALFFNQRCAEKGDRAIEGEVNRVLDGAAEWA
jgi:N-acyl-D-amino-acid deacylase